MTAVRASVEVTIEAVQIVSPRAYARARLLQMAVNIILAGGTRADARRALQKDGVKRITAWSIASMAHDVAGPVEREPHAVR